MRRRTIILTALSLLLLLVTISTLAPDSRQLTVVINEVCWAGSAGDHTTEWIELFNTTDAPIDLAGWLLVSSDGAPFIRLQGVLAPHTKTDPTSGYFLLERGSDNSVPAIAADQIYQGALTNSGEVLTLSDAAGRIIDTANIVLSEESGRAWPAGSDDSGNTPFASMERVQFQSVDAPGNWASSTSFVVDGGEQLLCGTPKGENSVYNALPVAHVIITPRIPHPGLPAEFSAAGSDDANDPIESYAWQFGDGTTATGAIVSHTYSEAGQYILTLLLTDSKGGETRVTYNVEVALTTPPIADFSVILKPDQAIARAAAVLTFQDESSDADSEIVSWIWTFGDGSEAVGRHATHTYDTFGDYIVGLQVTDTQGEVGIQTQSVSIAGQLPVPVLFFAPEFPNEGEPVLFDASESFDPDGVIVSYQWDFDGDGVLDAQGPEHSASYTYQSGGQFAPRVTVIDDQSEDASRESAVEVNAAPVAQFQVSSFEPNELEAVLYSDLSHDSDGTIVAWNWDFGDETRSDEGSPSHIYQQGGTMVVTLTVTDDGGATGSAVASLAVGNLPPAAVLSVADSSLPTGSRFSFDASGSSDPSPEGGLARYEWSFDGGDSFELETSVPTVSHAFTDDGQVTAQVRVTDLHGASGLSDPLLVTVTNRSPTVSRVTWTPSAPTDADEVVFSVQASDPDGQIAGWSWVMDSLVLASSQQLTHRFEDNGSYQVTLQVRDDDGASASPYTFTVPILNAPPVVAFTSASAQSSACDGSNVRFDASDSYDPSPTGRIVHVAWDFGDETNCPGSAAGCSDMDRWTPEHCYSGPGTYIVTLVVIDEHGAISRTQKTILIGE